MTSPGTGVGPVSEQTIEPGQRWQPEGLVDPLPRGDPTYRCGGRKNRYVPRDWQQHNVGVSSTTAAGCYIQLGYAAADRARKRQEGISQHLTVNAQFEGHRMRRMTRLGGRCAVPVISVVPKKKSCWLRWSLHQNGCRESANMARRPAVLVHDSRRTRRATGPRLAPTIVAGNEACGERVTGPRHPGLRGGHPSSVILDQQNGPPSTPYDTDAVGPAHHGRMLGCHPPANVHRLRPRARAPTVGRRDQTATTVSPLRPGTSAGRR